MSGHYPEFYRSPWQNGHSERMIGSVRRECTDHLIAFNADHLRRLLVKTTTYYNEMRTHVSLGKDAPRTRLIERIGEVVAHPILCLCRIDPCTGRGIIIGAGAIRYRGGCSMA
jgi:Integrase core domain